MKKKFLVATLSLLCMGFAAGGVACTAPQGGGDGGGDSSIVLLNGFNHWDDMIVIYLDPATFDGSMKLNKDENYIAEGASSYKCYINSTAANQPELKMAASGRKTDITDVSNFGLYIYNTEDYNFDVVVTAYAGDKAVCAPYATVQPGANNLIFNLNRAAVQLTGKVITEYSIAFSGLRGDSTFYIDKFYAKTTTDAVVVPAAAQAVINDIKALSESSTKAELEAIMGDYNALTADEKQAVTNYDRLETLIKPFWIQDLDTARTEDSSKLLYFDYSFASVQITGTTSGVGSYSYTSAKSYGNQNGSLKVDFTVSPTNWVNINTSAKNLIDEEFIEFYVYNDSDQYKAMCVGWKVPINANYDTYMVLEPHAWTQVWSKSTDLTNSGGSSGAFEICGLSDLTDRRACAPKGSVYFSSVVKVRPSEEAQAVIDEIDTLSGTSSKATLEGVYAKYRVLSTKDKQSVSNYGVLKELMVSKVWGADLDAAQTSDKDTLLFFDESFGVAQIAKVGEGISAYSYSTERTHEDEAGSLKIEFYEKMPGFMPVAGWMTLSTTMTEDIDDAEYIEFYVYNDSNQRKGLSLGWIAPVGCEGYQVLEPNAWTKVWAKATDLTTGLPEGDPAVYNYRGQIKIVAFNDVESVVVPEGALYFSSVQKIRPSAASQAVIDAIAALPANASKAQVRAVVEDYQELAAIDKQTVTNYDRLKALMAPFWTEDLDAAKTSNPNTLLHFDKDFGAMQVTSTDKGIAGYGYSQDKAYGTENGSLKVEFYEKGYGMLPVDSWMTLYTTATEDIDADYIEFYVYNDSNQYKGIALGWLAPDGSTFGYQILEPNAWTRVFCKSSDLTQGLGVGSPVEYNYRGRIQIVALKDLNSRSVVAPEGALYFSSVQEFEIESRVQEARTGDDANTLMFFDREMGAMQAVPAGNASAAFSSEKYNDEVGSLKVTFNENSGEDSKRISFLTCGYTFNEGDYVVFYVKADINLPYMTVRVGSSTAYGTYCHNGKWTQVVFPAAAFANTQDIRFDASDVPGQVNAYMDFAGDIYITKAIVVSASQVKNLTTDAASDYVYNVGQTQFVGSANYYLGGNGYLRSDIFKQDFDNNAVALVDGTIRFYARTDADKPNDPQETVITMALNEANSGNKMYIVASGLVSDEVYMQCFRGDYSGHYATASNSYNNFSYEVLEDGYVRYCFDLSTYSDAIKSFRLGTGQMLSNYAFELIHIRDVYFGD